MIATVYQRPPLRVAVIGCGRAFFEEHYSVFKEHPALFELVAACDVSKDRRDLVARDFPNCRMFRQFDDMLDEQFIDLVDIATPSADHIQHAMASLKRGPWWTLLESPSTLSAEDAVMLKAQAQKSKGRLVVCRRGMFDPDYLLAKSVIGDSRLGALMHVAVRREDYVRRDDWQCMKGIGGGAAYYAMPELVQQALHLLPMPPFQMWSDMKRIASLGDAEDYVHVEFKTRSIVSASIDYNGGRLPREVPAPSFELTGENGTFSVGRGASTGVFRVIDPDFKLPRRRSSVRTPPLGDLHEQIPIVDIPVSLPRETACGPSAFWRALYDTIRVAAPFPCTLEEVLEAEKYSHIMKKNSPFGR